MDFLPLFFDLRRKPCLLVGGGEVALRKGSLLLQAGACLRVVAPEVTPDLEQQVLSSRGRVMRRGFVPEDLDNMTLVVAATSDKAVNKQVSDAAHRRNIPVNVVDNPPLCSFIMPSIIDRSPVIIGISSGGTAPVLARLLRGKIEALIPHAYGRLAALVGRFRGAVKQHFGSVEARRNFWERVLEGPVAEQVFAGRESQAETLLQEILSHQSLPAKSVGEVYLVGGGPGDPDLITFKALRLMQQADVVLYDRLVSAPVLDLVRRDAQRIYVGKARNRHAVPQEGINELLVRLAREGKRVLRLKGGDPFIFGSGGEEIQKLAEQGIAFQVVPGITAASGCACYAGIPLTHRDFAQSVRFVTGHLKNGTADLPWAELVHQGQTLVFYMGLVGLPKICSSLMCHGRSPDTPVALVQKGTLPQQRVITGTLENITCKVEAAHIVPPTLIIVGEVVSLHETLSWFHPDDALPEAR
jgi:uroporphyrin-III C-methyltransferase/precorrin-2 dehydrogenase/sirohydrochlorin ferrochelatase